MTEILSLRGNSVFTSVLKLTERSRSLLAVNRSIVNDPNGSTIGSPLFLPERKCQPWKQIQNIQIESLPSINVVDMQSLECMKNLSNQLTLKRCILGWHLRQTKLNITQNSQAVTGHELKPVHVSECTYFFFQCSIKYNAKKKIKK
jgi:hypothetical protein